MFHSSSSNIAEKIGWLERIIDIIIKLIDALKGGSTTTVAKTTTIAETTTIASVE